VIRGDLLACTLVGVAERELGDPDASQADAAQGLAEDGWQKHSSATMSCVRRDASCWRVWKVASSMRWARLRATTFVAGQAFTDVACDIVDSRRRSEPDRRRLSHPAAGPVRG
jgi:hypothetical protein